MRSSHLPGKLSLLFLFFFLGSCLITGCSSRRDAQFLDKQPRARDAVFVLDINVATAEQLQELPTVGPILAQKIIDHRTRYGKFRKPEHLLVIDGISEKRFRAFRGHIDAK
jgi:competence ComEA-like helix-hairpin-helix protein